MILYLAKIDLVKTRAKAIEARLTLKKTKTKPRQWGHWIYEKFFK
jgi:hypothetical protein